MTQVWILNQHLVQLTVKLNDTNCKETGLNAWAGWTHQDLIIELRDSAGCTKGVMVSVVPPFFSFQHTNTTADTLTPS